MGQNSVFRVQNGVPNERGVLFLGVSLERGSTALYTTDKFSNNAC